MVPYARTSERQRSSTTMEIRHCASRTPEARRSNREMRGVCHLVPLGNGRTVREPSVREPSALAARLPHAPSFEDGEERSPSGGGRRSTPKPRRRSRSCRAVAVHNRGLAKKRHRARLAIDPSHLAAAIRLQVPGRDACGFRPTNMTRLGLWLPQSWRQRREGGRRPRGWPRPETLHYLE